MGRLLDINEAVEASGLSERRLRDILAAVEAGDETALPGAYKTEEGRWRIPEESARKLRRRLPLTEEEKKSIRERSQKGWPIKRIVREINAARGQAGDPPISESAVYKFLQKQGRTELSSREVPAEEPVPDMFVYTDPADLPEGIDKRALIEKLEGFEVRPAVTVSVDGGRTLLVDGLDLELDLSDLSSQERHQLEGVIFYGEHFHGAKKGALFGPKVLSIAEVIDMIPGRLIERYGTTDFSEILSQFRTVEEG